jgi:hypothetical protein
MPAQTIYPHVAGLCRRLGTWRPKTERPLHSQEQTTNKCTSHLTWRSVCVRACVRVEASGKSRSSCRLVHAGVLSKTTGKILMLASYPNDRQDPYAGVLSKRPARSLFGHTSHLTALRHRRVHVWMQVQHLLYTSEEHQYTRSLIWWLSIRQPKQYTSSLYPRQSIIACIDLRRYKWFTSSH